MNIQKWKKLTETDVSPSPWFPIVKRDYELPDGKIVKDFTITTIADVAMIIPVTPDKKVVFVRQYKPGVDDITIEFPAGRIEPHHGSIEDTAKHELVEETGIVAKTLIALPTIAGFPTKGTELIYGFLATDLTFTGEQHLDENENIEVLTLTPQEVDEYIQSGKIMTSHTIAYWYLVQRYHPEVFR
jgi:ADP-ribose pyrophosphatase